ncbi:MAG: DUF4443 domain-containing protein [Thermoproteota archaeon]
MVRLRAVPELRVLQQVMRKDKRAGAPRSFGLGHVFLALYQIDENARISRTKLGTNIGLGGGAIKSLISKLQKSHLLNTSKAGNVLSNKGKRIVSGLKMIVPIISEVKVHCISTGKKNVAAVLRGIDIKRLDPVTMRDDVVRAGGSGATTLLFNGESIRVPEVYDDLASVSIFDAKALLRLNLRRGDIILVAGGDDLRIASISCITAIIRFLSGCL